MELLFLIILIGIMATALGSGYPVAFALPGAAIITIGLAAGSGYIFAGSTDAYFHTGGPAQWLSAGVTNLRGVYWEVERDTLIAIPLFIFMGIMLQRSKIAEDLLVTMAGLFGPVPGGLGISVVFVGALLAATTGIVGATVVAMGLISLPAMLRNNYSPSLATGTIAASGTLGQIIPPSIVLIILADQLASATDQASTARKALHKATTGELSMPSAFDVSSTSAGEMFLGAFVPGLVLVALYMLFILAYALLRPSQAPAVPYEGERNARFWGKVLLTLIPPLALIFLVLGSIIAGIATVNQAGAIGAAGALIMAGYRLTEGNRNTYHPAILGIVALGGLAFALANYKMNVKALTPEDDLTGVYIGVASTVLLAVSLIWSAWRALKVQNTLQGVMIETAKTTSLVFIILLGAAMLTAAFRAFGGEELVRDFLTSLPGGFWSQFIIVMLVIFILGFFLDFIEIAVVVVPIVAPILLADPGANITAVWLGVMIGLNIQTSFLTPPFGFALFYLRGVAPAAVRTVQMYRGVIAFITLQLAALGIVGVYPQLVNYLPNRVSFLSETAPPPRNPKLQACLSDFVRDELAESTATVDAITRAKTLNLSALPEDLSKDFVDGLEDAETALAALDETYAAMAVVDEAAVDYRPLLANVRRLERDIRKDEREIEDLERELSRALDDGRKAEIEARLAHDRAEIETLRAQIPAEWEETHKAFAKLLQTEDKARTTFERSGDGAFDTASEVLATLNATPAFLELETALRDLRGAIAGASEATAETAEEAVDAVEDMFGDVEGAGDVKSALSKARRALRARSFDRDEALAEYEAALEEYEAQKEWRAEAEPLKPEIAAYVEGVRRTLGARSGDRLTEDQALFLASCTASHRNLSLYFQGGGPSPRAGLGSARGIAFSAGLAVMPGRRGQSTRPAPGPLRAACGVRRRLASRKGRERAKGAGDVMNRDHDQGPAAGEAVARAELDDAMAAYYDDLIAVVRRRGAEPWQATEIVHDLYVRLSGKPEALAGKSSIRAFLIRAAINLGVDRGRRRSFENRLFAMLDLRLEPADGAAEDEPAAATAIDAPRRVGALRDAIMELPPQRRSAFIASVVAGMDKDEIAERLGVTRGMVNRHLRKALAHCMDRMEEFDRGQSGKTPAIRLPSKGKRRARMTEAGRTDVRRIREAAADWALRLEDEDCGAAERRACEAWLDRDPAHRDAFDLARRVMGESARAFAGAPAAARPAARPAHPAPRRRMRAPFAMAAAAALDCLAFFAADGPARLAADARSGAGETPVIRLADGSTMRLNGETAVGLDFDAGARQVSLVRGQAYFEVAHDPARPFIVEAAGGEVMALGTAFDVNLVGGGVEVTVTESQIRATTAAGAREIAAGSRIAYDDAGAFGAVQEAPANLAAAWRFDRLAFEDRPLGRVAEALDRRLSGRLVVVGESLAARRVSGSFDIADADRALDAMTSVFGLRKVSLGPWLTLLY